MLWPAVLVTERKHILKQVLVLGAGQSSTYLIHHLLQLADTHDWFVTVGDMDLERAKLCVGDNPRGGAVCFDINDSSMRTAQIGKADVVINMLLPAYQDLVAWDCVNHGRHMISVSYRDQAVRDLDQDAQRKGVLLLCEMGLDPGHRPHVGHGADPQRVAPRAAAIVGFCSYGSGIPAPDQPQQSAALRHHLEPAQRGDGRRATAPSTWRTARSRSCRSTRSSTTPGRWTCDGRRARSRPTPTATRCPTWRPSGSSTCETMIRGTLRYPGWSETWAHDRPPRPAQRDAAHPRPAPSGPTRGRGDVPAAERQRRCRLEQRVGALPAASAPPGGSWRTCAGWACSPTSGSAATGDTAAAMLIHLLQTQAPADAGSARHGRAAARAGGRVPATSDAAPPSGSPRPGRRRASPAASRRWPGRWACRRPSPSSCCCAASCR